MRPVAWVLVALSLNLIFGSILPAGEIKRTVLALYDSSDPQGKTSDTCEACNYLQMPLERAGMRVVYHDADQRPLPQLDKYRAVVLWFSDNKMREPKKFCAWLAGGMEHGTRLIVVGGLGCETDPRGRRTSRKAINQVMALMGLKHAPNLPASDNPFALEVHDYRAGDFGYETKMPPARVEASRVIAFGTHVRVWRALRTRDQHESCGVLVATSARAGWIHAAEDVMRFFEKPAFSAFWDLDPFKFVEASLGSGDEPRPDVTTAFGRRAVFSHIDGDGMVNLTLDLPGPPRPASQVILEEILEKYPVPVCVGLVAARVDPAGVGQKKYLPLWRKIMSRPNVLAGAHGYAHPMNWAKETVGVKVPGYRFSEKLETVGAMEVLRKQALPEGKRVDIFLWTGDCSPGASAIRLVSEYGALNLNGGDPRLDQANNSITHLCPLSHAVGKSRQVYTAASNEYIYTDGWTKNYGGFAGVIETFKRTGSPLRLMPVNIYYHFYIGERTAGLASLRRVYDWALGRPLCWIHAEEYAASVNDFYRARFTRLGKKAYQVTSYGACRTVRLDHTSLNVDMHRSQNILGFTHYAGSLYISLGPGSKASFYLTGNAPDRPCLKSSTSVLRKVMATRDQWSARARLYAPGQLLLQGLSAGKKLAVKVGASSSMAQADRNGILKITLPRAWGKWVEVKVGY